MKSQASEGYLAQILQAFERGRIPEGKVTAVQVFHDSWCALVKGKGPCDCDPEIRVDAITGV